MTLNLYKASKPLVNSILPLGGDLPEDPVQLSYALLSVLPFQHCLLASLFSEPSATNRVEKIVNLLTSSSVNLECAKCGRSIEWLALRPVSDRAQLELVDMIRAVDWCLCSVDQPTPCRAHPTYYTDQTLCTESSPPECDANRTISPIR